MGGPRNNDRTVSSDIADAESTGPAGTETTAGDESGVETIARTPISRGVVIDERQQPLSAPQATTTTTPTTAAAEAQAGTSTRQAAPETGSRSRKSVATPSADETAEQAMGALFLQGDLQQFRTRWDQVQASFVDDPRRAVQEADTLVASVVKRIAEQFAEQRTKLEGEGSRGDEATTEELRRSLRQYRAFFERLLSI
jgi:hypothetical protein